MLNGLYITQHDSGVLLFEKKVETPQYDPDLFSSLLSAIRSFTSAIHMGELTSFTTHNKQILISLAEKVVVSMIMDLDDPTEEWQGLAYEIGQEFNKTFNHLQNYSGNRSQFVVFNEIADTILNQKSESFLMQVAKWGQKEYGGDLHMNQCLINKSNKQVPIDIVIDRGELKDLKFAEKFFSKAHPGYNRDLTFIRVIDDVAGQNEVEQYIENCREFDFECRREDRCEKYFDYFPSKIIVVARDFSPTVAERLEEITRKDRKTKKHYVFSTSFGWHGRFKAKKTLMFNCFVELWKWATPYPERVFF